MGKYELAFIFEVLQKYKGKYQSWCLVKIACLGEHIKIVFSEENAIYIPIFNRHHAERSV